MGQAGFGNGIQRGSGRGGGDDFCPPPFLGHSVKDLTKNMHYFTIFAPPLASRPPLEEFL